MLDTLVATWACNQKIRKNKIHKFKAKFAISLTRGNFTVKTVTTTDELLQALRLRYEVFYTEFIGTNRPGIDVDAYDSVCDHLIIIENLSKRVVGTYRLNSTIYASEFYSANEFEITQLLNMNKTLVELGRACIHRDFRKGTVMALLWRGIAQYMQSTKADYLFGCASVKVNNAYEASLLYHYFRALGALSESFDCSVTEGFQMDGLDEVLSLMDRPLIEIEIQRAETLIPPLLRSYIRAGAVICGKPAYDFDFKCIDFLTLLEVQNINGAHGKKYHVGS
jgi:putative hemolysin